MLKTGKYFLGYSEDWVPKTKSLFPIVNKIIDINNSKIGAIWFT